MKHPVGTAQTKKTPSGVKGSPYTAKPGQSGQTSNWKPAKAERKGQ